MKSLIKRLIYLAFAGAFLSAWIAAAGLLWLVMSPWLLFRFLVNRRRIPSGDMG